MHPRRLSPFICVLAILLILAPAAAADQILVTGISPNSGAPGTTVSCTVYGFFFCPTNPAVYEFEPYFNLVGPGGYDISGTPLSFDEQQGAWARVSFAIPSAAPSGAYDVVANQWWDLYAYGASRPGAFSVTAVTPAVTGINPASVTAGSPAFTLSVSGTNFATGSDGAVVRWNSSDLSTTRISSTTLTAAVPASLVATSGTATVSVRNGSGLWAPVSNSVTFSVVAAAPVVSSLSPTFVWGGCVRTDLVLTVTGSNFVSGSRIVINGGEKTNTAFVTATQLSVPLTAADMALPVTSLTISVKNPPFPGGAASAGSLPLTIQPETTYPTVTIAGADSAWHNTSVTLTFAASDTQSGVQRVVYMSAPTVPSWTDGTSYTVPTSAQGAVTVNVQALDWCNRAGTATATVYIDTTEPGTETLGNVTVKKGKTARLRYRVTEPAGLSPKADVSIKIERSSGSTVKSFTVDAVSVNTDLTKSFTCSLAKGRYTWYVYATDLAGNTQKNVARAKLVVK